MASPAPIPESTSNNHPGSFALPRASFPNPPPYPSPSPTSNYPAGIQRDDPVSSPVSGYPAHQSYGESSMHTFSPTTPYPQRSWPDRSFSSSGASISRSNESLGTTPHWPSGGGLGARSVSGSFDAASEPYRRESTASGYDQGQRSVAEMSSSILEVSPVRRHLA